MRGYLVFVILLACLAVCLLYVLIAPSINVWIVAGALIVCIALALSLNVFVLRPVRAVENGMNLLRAQDYASRLRNVGQKDTDNIVALFNDLMDRLKSERLRLEEQNLFLQQLIDASTQGIVTMDFNGKPMQLNPAAKTMIEEIEIPVLKERETKTIRSHSGMIYKVQRLSFLDRGHRHTFYLIESLTEEVRKAEREAYGRVIRTIAHEVNNTLGGINTVLQLTGSSTSDPDMVETIESCTERAGKLTQFISSYASLVKIPEPQTQCCLLSESMASMRPFIDASCTQAGIQVIWKTEGDCKVCLDPVLWEQVIVNIVKNSIEGIKAKGCENGVIEITSGSDGTVRITDTGIGIADDVAQQIFSPFFSTKPDGQGIGLMFVSEVLRRHNCQFSLLTDPASGLTTFKIRFVVADAVC